MLVDYEGSNAVVIDVGAHRTKAGYSGDEAPSVVFPSNVAIDRKEGAAHAYRLGVNELAVHKDGMEMSSPFQDGNVVDWNLWETLVTRVVDKQLGLLGEPRPLLMAVPPYSDAVRRERSLEFCFEKLDCPAVFLAKAPVLAAFAQGQVTALVLDSGHQTTTVTPVVEGYALSKACLWSPRAGHRLSLELLRALDAQGTHVRPRYSFTRRRLPDGRTDLVVHNFPNTHPSYALWARLEIAEGMKEAHFLVRPAQSTDQLPPQPYVMPDGTTVNIGEERWRIPEMLFEDDGAGGPSLPSMVLQAIQKVDHDARLPLCRALVTVGGTTLVEGLVSRLEKEVVANTPALAKAKTVMALPGASDRKNAVWLGGSILASLGTFQQLWVSKGEYQEQGRAVVHKKCP